MRSLLAVVPFVDARDSKKRWPLSSDDRDRSTALAGADVIRGAKECRIAGSYGTRPASVVTGSSWCASIASATLRSGEPQRVGVVAPRRRRVVGDQAEPGPGGSALGDEERRDTVAEEVQGRPWR